ncbi:MAG: hypothetical protein J0H34_07010 [Rhizobiales bacterium]|nr:hypothetical protein [Hyphomicrobiales bacterium]
MPDYRVVIIQDRYSGIYSGGDWLAVACATDEFDATQTRLDFILSAGAGPSGSDTDAGRFWLDPPPWISFGNTPDEALSKLRNSLK